MICGARCSSNGRQPLNKQQPHRLLTMGCRSRSQRWLPAPHRGTSGTPTPAGHVTHMQHTGRKQQKAASTGKHLLLCALLQLDEGKV
jgi:hypothetical protein